MIDAQVYKCMEMCRCMYTTAERSKGNRIGDSLFSNNGKPENQNPSNTFLSLHLIHDEWRLKPFTRLCVLDYLAWYSFRYHHVFEASWPRKCFRRTDFH